jgi:gluconolactonase
MDDNFLPVENLEGLVPAGAQLRRLATGATWSEGALWLADRNAVRWSDIPANRILEYSFAAGSVATYRDNVEFTNGRTLDLEGAVVQCSHGLRRVEKDVDGVVSVIVDSYDGHRFNSPNDVIVASDGTIWFTDPPYGIAESAREGHPGTREYGDCFVFRHDTRSGETTAVILDVEEPNGLAFSPDETLLYVSDTSGAADPTRGNRHIRVYDVVDGRCKNGRVFTVIDEGVSDGFRVDEHGNLWTSSAIGVQVFSAAGIRLGTIPVPEVVANVCFGGFSGTDLFIVATTSLYMIETLAHDAAGRLQR